MKKRLVLIGGGHAHMMTLAHLDMLVEKGYAVTVIQPSEFHYYSGMGPGMLGGTYRPEEIRFATRQVVESKGGSFVLGRAEQIDPLKQIVILAGGDEVGYDVLSCNVGSYVPFDIGADKAGTCFAVKPIEGLMAAQQRIIELSGQRSITIAIVGGGPSSIEIAGNCRQLTDSSDLHPAKIQVFAGRRLMSRLPERIQLDARRMLEKNAIEIIEGSYVEKIDSEQIQLANGNQFRADIIFSAVGVKPSNIFVKSGINTGPDGGLQVNKCLQSMQYPNIFGGGDCIYFEPRPLDRVGVYAVRQNPVLLNNLKAYLEGEALQPFDPGGSYLLIYNLGGGSGILYKWSFIFSGRLSFRVKDYIDRKFMEKFQSLER